ncbi:CCR4-NOT transcription complex subunit 4 [Alternaria panax]|uniref:CCR4-NOT transcription complex subunit 4 n=1 Tax=Alternaria panax TaxID=48097 RepID=A0AAD4FHU2_9PLEO|nr:CCR4-NOT transcription complex subunit 4 [Alternaria panax]
MVTAYDGPLSAEEQASINVDALVNDCDNEPTRPIPSTPLNGHFFEQPRRSTPAIPPGFTAPAIPKAVLEESRSRPGSRPMSRTASSNITPAVPVMPITPLVNATPGKTTKGKQKSDVVVPATPTAAPTVAKSLPSTPSRAATQEAALVVPQTPKEPTPREASRAAKEDVVQTPKSTPDAKRLMSEAAAKDTPKSKGASKKTQPATQTTPKKEPQKETARTPGTNATPATSTKRQPPSKLDISAATKLPGDESPAPSSAKVDSQTRNNRSLPTPSVGSVPPSPAAAATGSPIKRAGAPRTLRVVATPKAEAPPPLSAPSAPSLPQIPTVDKLRSRQASIASVNLPGTPSEMVSDTASVTSTSFSRASSPPPIGGKVGTAPVRKKTKSQAKKDRQERKKQIEEETLEDTKSDVEVMQAPIIGRKKKEKKPTTKPKPIAAAYKSQPASPKPATVEEVVAEGPTISRRVSSAKISTAATPEPEPEAEQPKERRENSAQSIMADLQRTGELLVSTLEFFKPLSSSLTHAARSTQNGNVTAPPDLKLHFSQADLDALAKKKPVRLSSQDGKPDSRTLITPNGKFFWGLTEELETKALELEKHIEERKGHARFHPRKQTAYSHSMTNSAHSNDVLPAIATALKEAGKKLNTNGGQQMPRLDHSSGLVGSTNLPLPPVQGQEASMPQVPPPQQQQTPANAGAYLNQYVLPKTDNPPPNQPRPEMAAVGGAPGAGTATMSVNSNKFAKAAKAFVEGGAVGSTEIDGMGMMAADRLGGVFVQGVEALVGAGLGYPSTQEFGLDGNGNMPMGNGGAGGLDMQGLMNAIETTAGMGGGYGGSARRGRGSVLTMEEAEQAMHAARREHDVLEKKLNALMKKNKKLATGGGK